MCAGFRARGNLQPRFVCPRMQHSFRPDTLESVGSSLNRRTIVANLSASDYCAASHLSRTMHGSASKVVTPGGSPRSTPIETTRHQTERTKPVLDGLPAIFPTENGPAGGRAAHLSGARKRRIEEPDSEQSLDQTKIFNRRRWSGGRSYADFAAESRMVVEPSTIPAPGTLRHPYLGRPRESDRGHPHALHRTG